MCGVGLCHPSSVIKSPGALTAGAWPLTGTRAALAAVQSRQSCFRSALVQVEGACVHSGNDVLQDVAAMVKGLVDTCATAGRVILDVAPADGKGRPGAGVGEDHDS